MEGDERACISLSEAARRIASALDRKSDSVRVQIANGTLKSGDVLEFQHRPTKTGSTTVRRVVEDSVERYLQHIGKVGGSPDQSMAARNSTRRRLSASTPDLHAAVEDLRSELQDLKTAQQRAGEQNTAALRTMSELLAHLAETTSLPPTG